jgi:hypothetical protein
VTRRHDIKRAKTQDNKKIKAGVQPVFVFPDRENNTRMKAKNQCYGV